MDEHHAIDGGGLRKNAVRALEELGEGFLEDLRARPRELAAWRRKHAHASSAHGFDASEELLAEIQRESLCLLFRVLFLFYAEARGLLPARGKGRGLDSDLEALREEVGAALERPGASAPFDKNGARLWERLLTVFRRIREVRGSDGGNFGADLFDPERHDFLERFRVGDSHLALALDLLSRAQTRRAGGSRAPRRERVDFRRLDVRELGAVYEGLLEFSASRADVRDGARRFRLVRRGRASSARRATGSYYTPDYVVRYLVEQALGPLVRGEGRGEGRGQPLAPREILALRMIDPASGSGHFLLAATEYLARAYGEALRHESGSAPRRATVEEFARHKRLVARRCVYGVDTDATAVVLSKLSLQLFTAVRGLPPVSFDERLKTGDTLAGRAAWPLKETCFDAVVGNPPWLFLSGRGSPSKALEKTGNLPEACALARSYDSLARRFPRSSEGCRDFYKWFIEASLDLAKPCGVVGLVVPNTWLTLPRYADVRRLLLGRGLSRIVDLGFGVFPGLSVPTCVFISGHAAGGVLYSDLKGLCKDGLTFEALDDAVRSGQTRLPTNGGDFRFYRTALAERLSESRGLVRGDEFFKASEGEHGLRVARDEVSKEGGRGMLPVVLDWTTGRFEPPGLGFLPHALCPKYSAALHAGPRVILRKTGDKLVSAVCPTEALAVAHQNVYVVKPLGERVSVHALQGLLGSKLLTYLYRNGPLGQTRRALAQFRIKGLYALPFPDPETLRAELDELESLSVSLHEEKNECAWAKLNEIVYGLYRLTRREVKDVEAGTADVNLGGPRAAD